MAYFLALDAGGTSTRCCVADEARVLATASCGTVKLMSVGNQTATARLVELLKETAGKADVELLHVTRTCMGLAGISAAAVRGWAQVTLEQNVGGAIDLCGDEEIALEGAFRGGPGILVIAGTGSHIVGRCSDGTMVSAGGWGPVVGDEGSGSWIGLQAMRAAFRARDRGEPTALLVAAQEIWNLENLGQLIAKVNHRDRPDFSQLTESVVKCAAAGDVVALSVLERAGRELADQVVLVVKKMQAVSCTAGDTSQVAFTGSILSKVGPVQRSFEASLHRQIPAARLADAPVEPLEGALWKARRG
jgi:glucosamine kinase